MKLKHLILATTLLSTSTALAEGGNFYLKLKMERFNPEKIHGFKGKATVAPSFGIGYNFADNARVDFSIKHFAHIKHTTSIGNDHPINQHIIPVCPVNPPAYTDIHPANIQVGNLRTLCTHAKIFTGKVNLYVDVIKIKKSSVFLGAGIGLSQISGSITVDDHIILVKPTYTIAYDLQIGIGHKIQDDVNLEIGYSYKHLTQDIYNYKGHSIFSSIRMDL